MSINERYTYDENCIAVIGMALRVPGADTPEALWENLMSGCISRERLSDGQLAGSMHDAFRSREHYVPYRYSISDYERFDAEFFNMPPREASLTDPQHRLVLEYAMRAVEHAGYVPADSGGLRTGVFASSDLSHYMMGNLYPHFCNGSIDVIESCVGNDKDYLATRVSYKCNFIGPSLTVQTACSSSLTALHMAVLSILGGECDRAVVASSTVLLPDLGYLYEPGGIRSPDGLCRPYDAEAGGAVFSNGVAAVLLKPLADAMRDRDTVWAVIRGTAAGNDGSDKIGFVAPSVSGQARAVRSALSVAGVSPEDIDYVEGHGTGTPLGDPIELAALQQVFGPVRERRSSPIVLSSLKGNIGHLDSTAGLASFIKACLCVHHGVVPATANFKRLNPAFGDIEPLTVSARPVTLERRPDKPILAGVSAFGFGGTNIHVVLQEAPIRTGLPGAGPHPLLLSAPRKESLRKMQAELGSFLKTTSLPLTDVAYTLAAGRRGFKWRSALVVESPEQAGRILADNAPRITAAVSDDVQAAFLFPGQGNLHARAGAAFYRNDAIFREKLDAVAALLCSHGGPDIVHILAECDQSPDAADGVLASTIVAQPLLFALETAFAETLVHRGVRPSCLAGHSLGEYAAAVTAGVFSLEDAARLVLRRATLMQSAPAGKMLMLTAHQNALPDVLGTLFRDIEICVVNGPANCVVTGSPQILEDCVKAVEAKGMRAMYLKTSHAFHSSSMDGVLERFRKAFDGITLRAPSIPVAGNLTGGWTAEAMATPEYWVQHLRSTVQFDRCLATIASKTSLGVEVGPGLVMRSLGNRPDLSFSVASGLDSPESMYAVETASRSMADVAAELWTQGAGIDWEQFYADETPGRCPLPGVALHPSRFWIEGVALTGQATDSVPFSRMAEQYEREESDDHVAPTNEVERHLVDIWQELLLIKPIGVTEEFLALGGNSVQIMQMLRLAEEKGIRLTVKDVFEGKTVAELARRAALSSRADAAPARALVLPAYFSFMAEKKVFPVHYRVFSCPDAFAHKDAQALALALARRHDILRLSRSEGQARILGKTEADRAAAQAAASSQGWPVSDFEDLRAGRIRNARDLPPLCGQELLWRLDLLPAGSGTQGVFLLATVSGAVCDHSGFRMLCREISRYIASGSLPETPADSWQSWLNSLPGACFASEYGKAAATDGCGGPAGSRPSVIPEEREFRFSINDPDLMHNLEIAAARCRIPLSDLTACAVARAIGPLLPDAPVFRVWRNAREETAVYRACRCGVGMCSYPLDIDPGEMPCDDEEAIPAFKAALHRAGASGALAGFSQRAFNFIWTELHGPDAPESAGGTPDSPEPMNCGTAYTPEGAGALRLLATKTGAGMGFSLMGMPGQAEDVAGRLIEALEGIAATGRQSEASRRYLPADFPFSDLTADELDRILHEIGTCNVAISYSGHG